MEHSPYGSTSWTPLSDVGVYSGSATAALHISSSDKTINGSQYKCTVSKFSYQTTSTADDSHLEDPLVVSTTFFGKLRRTAI